MCFVQISPVLLFDSLLLLLAAVWLALGSHWVAELHDRINYETSHPNQDVSPAVWRVVMSCVN